MRDVKMVTKKLGYGQAPMPEADPHAAEGTCPLCGVYGPLSRMGWCYDRDCKERARQMLRDEAAENGGTVPGQYYRVGDVELVNLVVFESYADPNPEPIKHPDMCVVDGCETFALAMDTLCPAHRLQANARRYDAIRRARQGKARRQKGRDHKIGNKIRGLADIKLGGR